MIQATQEANWLSLYKICSASLTLACLRSCFNILLPSPLPVEERKPSLSTTAMIGNLGVFCDLPTEGTCLLQRSQDTAFNLAWTQFPLPGTISNRSVAQSKESFFPFSGFLCSTSLQQQSERASNIRGGEKPMKLDFKHTARHCALAAERHMLFHGHGHIRESPSIMGHCRKCWEHREFHRCPA